MSNKLQNVKAVRDLLAGKHRTQTRKTFTFSKGPEKDMDVVERFEDGKPKVWYETDAKGTRHKWTQKEGYRVKEAANSLLSSIKDVLTAPDDCPECGEYMKGDEKRLNLKFYFKRKKCFSCVLKEEREIKNQGAEAWDEYQRKIMSDNAEAWFRDCDIEVDILKDQVKEAYWHNADGRSDDIDITQFVERMQKDYKELKETIRKNLAEPSNKKTDDNNLG